MKRAYTKPFLTIICESMEAEHQDTRSDIRNTTIVPRESLEKHLKQSRSAAFNLKKDNG